MFVSCAQFHFTRMQIIRCTGRTLFANALHHKTNARNLGIRATPPQSRLHTIFTRTNERMNLFFIIMEKFLFGFCSSGIFVIVGFVLRWTNNNRWNMPEPEAEIMFLFTGETEKKIHAFIFIHFPVEYVCRLCVSNIIFQLYWRVRSMMCPICK